ncbi:phosphoribosylglycinamide formyltransferase [Lysobacter sp. H23M47]|uniref:phosphoribosylglycinamide formyltransferase n=1 Tax=Lysobacter sp. H23M47 TaxID=2781024 RepID=UPI001881CDBE|nr:phosphoribosylglycinamide formyltransferase [Lysobacter sp. H23M47]QOW25268.1 phosphoribosylglycinamide formyltransferase [Lysobacter sp. H23M47]
MTSPLRIAVLASGRGSNLQAIMDAIAAGTLDAQMVGVFSDRRRAPVLERAERAGVPAVSVQRKRFPDRQAYETELFSRIDATRPDLIVCAGYMRLLGAAAVDAHAGRIINIHPSLLPAHKGLHTHQQALDARASEHGASVHYVTAELDGGPVIAHACLPVLPGDDAERLAARVLQREHPLLVATLRLFAARRIELRDEAIHIDGLRLEAPMKLDSDNNLHPPLLTTT